MSPKKQIISVKPKKVGRPKKKHAGGRPPKITKEVVAKLETAFSNGCTDLEACLYANISKHTLYRYIEINPDFWDWKERVKQNPSMMAKMNVVQKIRSKDYSASLWWLERKNREEFSTRSEMTGADGEPIQSININIVWMAKPLISNSRQISNNNKPWLPSPTQ